MRRRETGCYGALCEVMVEERITDGKRIAQFLASELAGLESGPLAHVEVVDADTDIEPAPDGARAYRIAFEEDAIASVVLFPNAVEVQLESDRLWSRADPGTDVAIDGPTLTVESVAAVKQAVDSLRETLESNGYR